MRTKNGFTKRSGKAHHHHFLCDRCSRVFELTGCVPSVNRRAGRWFCLSRHELVLYRPEPGVPCTRSNLFVFVGLGRMTFVTCRSSLGRRYAVDLASRA
jgi:hypothetical protein